MDNWPSGPSKPSPPPRFSKIQRLLWAVSAVPDISGGRPAYQGAAPRQTLLFLSFCREAKDSTFQSIRDNGQLSFGHALFRLVKLKHIRQVTLLFLTMTGPRLYSASSLGAPIMSEGFEAKTSRMFDSSRKSWFFTCVGRLAPIVMGWSGYLMMTFFSLGVPHRMGSYAISRMLLSSTVTAKLASLPG
ncbi:hypothetical protein Tco_0727215 [Tanacetum coccineum]|uniref:Uncharacterized protein n=1 Tax=Tanacetum coccineum TaxID=301880 RepID=A0ABQ4YHT4_9ASTR